jgi:hypothetical protein
MARLITQLIAWLAKKLVVYVVIFAVRAFAWLGYSWTGRAVVMSFTDFSRLSR